MKRVVEFTQTVAVTMDETKFTPEFMDEFRENVYDFTDLDEHAEHLSQLYARGIIGGYCDEFVEGYGLIGDFGISFEEVSSDIYTQPY